MSCRVRVENEYLVPFLPLETDPEVAENVPEDACTPHRKKSAIQPTEHAVFSLSQIQPPVPSGAGTASSRACHRWCGAYVQSIAIILYRIIGFSLTVPGIFLFYGPCTCII